MSDQIEVTVNRLADDLAEGDGGAALEEFINLHPADQASVLRDLPSQRRVQLLEALDDEHLAAILPEIEGDDLALIANHLPPARLAAVLDLAPPDTAADALRTLEMVVPELILASMQRAGEVRPLLVHGDETAGGIMLPNVVALPKTMTVAAALRFLRQTHPSEESIYYIYIVDSARRLQGVVSLRAIVTADPFTTLGDIMDPHTISVPVGTDQEKCARLLQRYNLLALPVVDDQGHLVGSITADEVMDIAEDEATEDMFRMVGLDEDERPIGPIHRSVRRRLPWLLINMLTAFAAASVVGLFEATIEAVAFVAVFMPIVAGMGGNATTQVVTVVVRGLALGEIDLADGWRILGREFGVGLIHGVTLGLLIGLVAFLWRGELYLGLILGVAMLLNIITAGLAGAAVPITLRLLRIDPALGSTVLVTTVTDIFGFFFFLGLATLFITQLTG